MEAPLCPVRVDTSGSAGGGPRGRPTQGFGGGPRGRPTQGFGGSNSSFPQERADPPGERDAPFDRFGQRQAQLGQVEVLDAQRPLVADAVQRHDDGPEVDVARLVGCT